MNNVYLIYGSDYQRLKKEVDKLTYGNSEVVKYDLSVDKIDLLLDDALSMSMFGDKKVLIGENALFLTGISTSIEHDLNYLSNYINDDVHDNVVILTVCEEKLDERKKIVKQFKDKCTIIKKEKIDDKNLGLFVQSEFKEKGYNISLKDANYFVDIASKNVDILINEIEKMILYKSDDKKITIDDINNITSKMLNDNVFDLTNAIMIKDYKKIFDCYNDLMTIGEEPIKLIILLANQFRLIYQCKILQNSYLTQDQISKRLGIHPYRVKLSLEADFTINELKEYLLNLHKLDYQIKSGRIDKQRAFENFLLNL